MIRNEKILHDLMAPLARAKTIAKLMQEENPEEEHLPILLDALEDLGVMLNDYFAKASK